LENPAMASNLRQQLVALRAQVGQTGACSKAAELILEMGKQKAVA
jgi:hypothetical protein